MARKLRLLDWMLVVVLTGVWALTFVRALHDGVQTGFARARVSLRSASGPDAYPTVREVPVRGWNVDLQEGDEVLAVDDWNLAGRSALAFFEAANRAVQQGGVVSLRIRRAGAIANVRTESTTTAGWWLYLGASAAVMAVALLLFIRAPSWHVARQYFAGTWCFCVTSLLIPSMVPPRAILDGVLAWLLFPLGAFLLVLVAQEFTRSARPVPWTQRALAGLVLLLFAALFATLSSVPLPGPIDAGLRLLALPMFVAAIVAGLLRTYRRSEPLERRQIRWLFLGGMIGAIAGVLESIASRLQSLTRDLGALIAIDTVTRTRAGEVCADFGCHAAVAIRGRSDRCDVWALPIAGPTTGVSAAASR